MTCPERKAGRASQASYQNVAAAPKMQNAMCGGSGIDRGISKAGKSLFAFVKSSTLSGMTAARVV